MTCPTGQVRVAVPFSRALAQMPALTAPLQVTCGHAVMLEWMSADDLVAAADRTLLARKTGRVSVRRAS